MYATPEEVTRFEEIIAAARSRVERCHWQGDDEFSYDVAKCIAWLSDPDRPIEGEVFQ